MNKVTTLTLYYPRKQGEAQGRKGPAATVIQTSETAAKIFHPAFAAALRSELKDNGIRGDEQTEIGSKQGALTGSIFSAVPTLLVEMVNLAKREDARWISQPEKQQLMAQALLGGVVAVAQQRSLSNRSHFSAYQNAVLYVERSFRDIGIHHVDLKPSVWATR